MRYSSVQAKRNDPICFSCIYSIIFLISLSSNVAIESLKVDLDDTIGIRICVLFVTALWKTRSHSLQSLERPSNEQLKRQKVNGMI